jgi:hypothetical protein
MKLLLTLILTSIVQSAPIQLLNSHDWITFAPKTGDFSVRLPGQPTESLEYMDFKSMKIELVRFSYLKNDVGFFIVRIGDLPEELVTNGYLEFFFENAYKKLLGYKTKEGKSST